MKHNLHTHTRRDTQNTTLWALAQCWREGERRNEENQVEKKESVGKVPRVRPRESESEVKIAFIIAQKEIM